MSSSIAVDPQSVEHQSTLNESNGSRQSSQRHSALQLVEPKRESSLVRADPHCGQRTDRLSGIEPVWCVGGAMPAACSLVLACRGHPVGGPGGGEDGLDADVDAVHRSADVFLDRRHRRAAGVGRRDRDADVIAVDRDVAQDAELGDGHERKLGIDDGFDRSCGRRRASPCRALVLSGERLHLVEQLRKVRGVVAALRGGNRGRHGQRGGGEDVGEVRTYVVLRPRGAGEQSSVTSGQTASAASCIRECETSVPSPSRRTQASACSR